MSDQGQFLIRTDETAPPGDVLPALARLLLNIAAKENRGSRQEAEGVYSVRERKTAGPALPQTGTGRKRKSSVRIIRREA